MKINLYWYKYNHGKGNFGDELNPYIIKRISTQDINYIDIYFLEQNKSLAFKNLRKAYGRGDISAREVLRYLYYIYVSFPSTILAIGSVLHLNKNSKSIVWGSGIIDQKYDFPNANFTAVRGKYSQMKLKEMGYLSPEAVGDPALLLPLIFSPQVSKAYKIGIIPHYVHYKDLVGRFQGEDVMIIDVLQEVEAVIEQLLSCQVILSTSLHGVIVSHAYGVPSIWADFSGLKCKLLGDNIKFRDYFSSVGIREYEAASFTSEQGNFDLRGLDDLLESSYSDVLLPQQGRVSEIQQNLLKVAPFKLRKEFQGDG